MPELNLQLIKPVVIRATFLQSLEEFFIFIIQTCTIIINPILFRNDQCNTYRQSSNPIILCVMLFINQYTKFLIIIYKLGTKNN